MIEYVYLISSSSRLGAMHQRLNGIKGIHTNNDVAICLQLSTEK